METCSKTELFLLAEGETLEHKAVELITKGIGIADLERIKDWVKTDPRVSSLQIPIVIVDPLTEPRLTDIDPPLFFVPAYAIDERGRHFPDGWIDFAVPMWPVKAGGQLAILGLILERPES